LLSRPASTHQINCAFRPHLFESGLGRNAAIHDPQSVHLSVTAFLFAKELRRVFYSDVFAWHYFIGDRKTFGSNDQGNDHLHRSRAFIRLVAKATQSIGLFWGITFQK